MKREPLNQRFLAAYDEYADGLFRFCYAHSGQRELSRDLVQETFTRTWNYLVQGKKIEQLRPFLYRTARNAMIDSLRRHKEQSLDVLQDAGWDVVDAHADPALSAEASRAIHLATRLEEKYREVFLMRYVDEMPPREIAQVTGESENAVSVRIHRALNMLRNIMDTDQ